MDFQLFKVAGDSEILDIGDGRDEGNRESAPELIYASSLSLLYRLKKDGKFFIVKKTMVPGEKGCKMLRREYELSIGCDHPNIVHVYEYNEDALNGDEILMEYVEGRDLNDFLSEKPSLKSRKRIFSELLEAVLYLHRRRIIHNDLKPANILVSRNGDRLKLIDLGLSDDDAHYAIKTPGFSKGYVAPEILEGHRADERSDIYSIGILMRQIFGRKYSSIVKRCLLPDPGKRYKGIEALAKSWQRSYLKWLIPLIFMGAALIAVIIVHFSKDNIEQNRRLQEFEQIIARQNQELNSQREAYISLEESYSGMRDSLENIINTAALHENLKKEKVAAFRQLLLANAKISIDSLKRYDEISQKVAIMNNFYDKVQRLYGKEEKILDGEDISPQLHSILLEEMENYNKIANYYLNLNLQ